jgi:hypothetical protein
MSLKIRDAKLRGKDDSESRSASPSAGESTKFLILQSSKLKAQSYKRRLV